MTYGPLFRCISTDDIFKSSSCLTDMLLDPKLANSDEPTQTPFNLAFQTSLGIFPWFELPENAQRLQRFGLGMEGGKAMFNPKAVLQGEYACELILDIIDGVCAMCMFCTLILLTRCAFIRF